MNWLILAAALVSSPAPVTEVEAVDEEMIELLALREDQVGGYVAIMQTQRQAYQKLEQRREEQLSRFYDDTLEMLSEVLDPRQLMQFAAFLDCLERERASRRSIRESEDTHLSRRTTARDPS